MGENSVTLNANVTTGSSVATFKDSSNKDHQEVIVQIQSGGGDPSSINTGNPLPILVTGANGTVNIAGTSPITLSGANGTVNIVGTVPILFAAGGTFTLGTMALAGTPGVALTGANGTVNIVGTVPVSVTGANGTVNLAGTALVNIVAGGIAGQVDNTQFTAGTSTGVLITCVYNDTAANLTSGSAGVPRLTAARQLLVAPQAVSTGGWTPVTYISNGGTNTGTNVKASPGIIGSIIVGNNGTATAYLKIYNSTTAPRMGTDTPIQNILIPGNTNGAGFSYPITAPGLQFTVGIGFGLSSGIALLDVAVVATNAITVNFGYL